VFVPQRFTPYIKEMEALLEKVGDVQVLHLRGRLDLATSPDFATLLQGLIVGGETKIVMDCRDLKYVSSSGLGTFIAAGKSLSGNGKLVFAGLSAHLQSLFDMTGIANLFEICGTKDDAVLKLGEDPARPSIT
jgi:anti-sigma B factor antagonist